MSKLRVNYSALTNAIYAGILNKDETMWKRIKYDVTDDAINAMIDLLKHSPIRYERDGKKYELKEVEISN